MAQNVEIKARIYDLERLREQVETLAEPQFCRFFQEDTFFHVPHGRLKLRMFDDQSGELIQYMREDTHAPTVSLYTIVPTHQPQILKQALSTSLGVQAVVRKQRTVYMIGRTRIHLDQVEQLGDFLELEVVMRNAEPQ
ncbi:MAG: class IV adenylate cyclase [Myxococcota bacterium]